MKLYVIWKTSIKNIFKNKKRAFLTMLGIIIGVAAVITIVALGNAFKKETISNLTEFSNGKMAISISFIPDDDELLRNKDTIYYYPNDLELLKKIDGVEDAKLMTDEEDGEKIYTVNIFGKQKNQRVKKVKQGKQKVVIGRTINTSDQLTHNKVVVIDDVLAKKLYKSTQKALGNGLEIEKQIFTIIGIFNTKQDDLFSSKPNIEIPKSTNDLYFPEKNTSNTVSVAFDPAIKPQKIGKKVLAALKEKGVMRGSGTYEINDSSNYIDAIGKVINGLTLFVSAIASISLFIAGVGVMNMMYISVSERTKEIGIRRALGAKQNAIRMQFLLEGVSISLIGGLLGYFFGIISAKAVAVFLELTVTFDLSTLFLSIGLSVAIGVIFSVMPASAAARKELIDILR